MAELSDAFRIHEELSRILILLPSSLIHSWEKILEYEINAHPNYYQDSILAYPLNNLMNEGQGVEKIISFLKSNSLVSARNQQKENSKRMIDRHNEIKNNFSSKDNGRYSVARQVYLQW